MINKNISKVILITGGARRLGAAMVRKLHQQDYNILLHYNTSHQDAEALAAELNNKRPGSVKLLQADLCSLCHAHKSENLLINIIEQAIAPWGRLDGLINNASVFYPSDLTASLIEQWDHMMAVNAKIPLLLAQATLPLMQKTQGSVINIVDLHSLKPLKDFSVYSASKAALRSLTLALAKEFAPNVRVNGIAPGNILWPEGRSELTTKQQAKLIKKIPLKRLGDPEDIAEAVIYLLQANYVTGMILTVDGGRSL